MKHTVLVVDDQPQVRRLLEGLLDRAGYAVLEAEDFDSAIEAVRQHEGPIALALVDIELPGRGGREVAAQIQAMARIPVIFISGHQPEMLIADGRLAADAPLVRKPFTVASIIEAVNTAVRPRPILE